MTLLKYELTRYFPFDSPNKKVNMKIVCELKSEKCLQFYWLNYEFTAELWKMYSGQVLFNVMLLYLLFTLPYFYFFTCFVWNKHQTRYTNPNFI